jgi:hypothetical protein
MMHIMHGIDGDNEMLIYVYYNSVEMIDSGDLNLKANSYCLLETELIELKRQVKGLSNFRRLKH